MRRSMKQNFKARRSKFKADPVFSLCELRNIVFFTVVSLLIWNCDSFLSSTHETKKKTSDSIILHHHPPYAKFIGFLLISGPKKFTINCFHMAYGLSVAHSTNFAHPKIRNSFKQTCQQQNSHRPTTHSPKALQSLIFFRVWVLNIYIFRTYLQYVFCVACKNDPRIGQCLCLARGHTAKHNQCDNQRMR